MFLFFQFALLCYFDNSITTAQRCFFSHNSCNAAIIPTIQPSLVGITATTTATSYVTITATTFNCCNNTATSTAAATTDQRSTTAAAAGSTVHIDIQRSLEDGNQRTSDQR